MQNGNKKDPNNDSNFESGIFVQYAHEIWEFLIHPLIL